MKNNIFVTIILVLQIFIAGCDRVIIIDTEIIEPRPYIKSYIDAGDPCDETYFIRVNYDDKDVLYTTDSSNVVSGSAYGSGLLNVDGKGYFFKNMSTEESVNVMFYYSRNNPYFHITTADYYYANSWQGYTGANIEIYVPVNNPDNPYSFYRYDGYNALNTYFYITYFDNIRICGEFYTFMKECCGGELTFWATGEFSIPRIYF
jgi:hypothetical protein